MIHTKYMTEFEKGKYLPEQKPLRLIESSTTAKTYISQVWITIVPLDTQREIPLVFDPTFEPHVDDIRWFWTKEWQAGEREAEKDFEEGRFTDVNTIEELLSVLHAEKKKRAKKNKS